MELANRWLNKLDQFFAYISAAAIFVMMVWIFLDVVLRTTVNKPITGTMELTGEYFMVLIVYFAISYTLKHNGHVKVDLFEHKFSRGAKRVFGLISNGLAVVVMVVLGINNFSKAIEFIEKDIRSVGLLNYSLAPAMMIISLGILVFSLRLVIDSINIILDKKEFR